MRTFVEFMCDTGTRVVEGKVGTKRTCAVRLIEKRHCMCDVSKQVQQPAYSFAHAEVFCISVGGSHAVLDFHGVNPFAAIFFVAMEAARWGSSDNQGLGGPREFGERQHWTVDHPKLVSIDS